MAENPTDIKSINLIHRQKDFMLLYIPYDDMFLLTNVTILKQYDFILFVYKSVSEICLRRKSMRCMLRRGSRAAGKRKL